MKRIAFVLVLVLGALASTTLGHAAALQVSAGSLTSFSAQHPCPGPATAVPSGASGSTYTGVTITLASAACSGRPVRARVVTSAGLLVVEGQIPANGTTATLTVPPYTAGSSYTVHATVSGWHLPTTWSFTPPVAAQAITAGNGATVIESVEWSTGVPTCATVKVTTNTAQEAPWRVALNVAAAPFNGATTGYYLENTQVRFDPSATPVNGVIGIVGQINGWDTLPAGKFREFRVCR